LLRPYSCGHVALLLIRASGDRLVLVSDGVVQGGPGQAGLGEHDLVRAVLGGDHDSASATVRAVHAAELKATGGNLTDDATVVCLQAG
jgi:serine phosphatase RsbU (regulator of sigma subunit)